MNRAILVACCVAGLTIAVGAERKTSTTGTMAQAHEDLGGLREKVQTLVDADAIRAIPSCYGYGHDLIFRHLKGDHSDALEALRRCHVDNLITNVYLFDETKPNAQLHSITDLINFVEGFAVREGYSSARNVPGNIQIAFAGPATAQVLSSTVAPHFLTNGPNSPAADFVEARYVDRVARGNDGVWRAVEFDLVVQQIWRGTGIYPFATP